MTNIFIIHSYNGDTKESFGPYLVDKLTEIGINVIFPSFPIKEEATYEKWSEIMDQYLLNGYLNKETIIIAHSLGTHFIPKYLADNNLSIGLYISCAGFINDHSGKESLKRIIKDFTPSKKQIADSKKLMQDRYSIYSENDHLNPIEELEYYAEVFDAKKVYVPGIGHLGKSSGIKELPEALQIVINYLENKKAVR